MIHPCTPKTMNNGGSIFPRNMGFVFALKMRVPHIGSQGITRSIGMGPPCQGPLFFGFRWGNTSYKCVCDLREISKLNGPRKNLSI